MRRHALFAVVGVLLLAATVVPSQAQTVRVGVFDPLRVSEETAQGKKIAERLRAYFESKQAELTRLQEQLAELQKQRQTQALSLSTAKRDEMDRNIQRKALELESAREAATRELQLEQASAEREFEQMLLGVVDAFGKREGFTLIFDRNQMVWADKKADVTTGIVDLFNEMIKDEDDQGDAE